MVRRRHLRWVMIPPMVPAGITAQEGTILCPFLGDDPILAQEGTLVFGDGTLVRKERGKRGPSWSAVGAYGG